MTAAGDESTVLSAIARHGLNGEKFAVIPGTERVGLVEALQQHRLVGVAARCLEEGALELDDDPAASLVAAHDSAMAATLRVELVALRAIELLTTASLNYRLLKGSALAHTVALDPADREFRDVDLLIAASDIDMAIRTLLDAGAQRLNAELRPGFDRRFGKSVTMRFDGIEIDLHRVLDPGPFGVSTIAGDLFVVPQRYRIADREIITLDPTDHLLHACYHVALGQVDPVLSNLRDVALLASGDCDVARLTRTVDRWRGRAVMARAVSLLRTDLGWEPPAALAAFTPHVDDAELLAPYLVSGDRFPALAKATLRALPPRDRLAYARAIGFPAGSKPLSRLRSLAKIITPRCVMVGSALYAGFGAAVGSDHDRKGRRILVERLG